MMKQSRKAAWAAGILVVMMAFSCLAVRSWAQQDDAAMTTEASLESMVISPGGSIEKLRYFTLKAPARLVVDLYGSGFDRPKAKTGLSGGFKRVRTSLTKERLRYVFDSATSTLPHYTVERQGGEVRVTWKAFSAPAVSHSNDAMNGSAVTSMDFSVDGSRSLFEVGVSQPVVLEPTKQDGTNVVWGIRNATIRPSLRRYIDTGAFPSIVKKITPYIAGDDVRFSVELREKVPFEIARQDGKVVFSVENGSYAFKRNEDATAKVPALASGKVAAAEETASSTASGPVTAPPAKPSPTVTSPVTKPQKGGFVESSNQTITLAKSKGKHYTGQKITLIFDDADIRNILQLIAEVSNLNIIANDGVKGNLTLRLVDVPWDQALDVILQIMELGTIQEGNILRVLPKKQIHKMVEAELAAAKAKEKLEPLSTEVFKISYTDLGNITKAVKELISDRGKITEDARNKQLIISDVPSHFAQIRDLVKILDTPERQVMIEARIVEATSSFARDLGVNWGIRTDWEGDQNALQFIDVTGGGSFTLPDQDRTSNTFPAQAGIQTALQFGTLGMDPFVLGLRLAALENTGDGKVISSPKVATLNGEEAVISQGTEIPYRTISQEGTKIEFKDAVLELKVTPVINPDNTVILKIQAKNDSPRAIEGADSLAIDKKLAKTTVLVRDTQTAVLGGIYVETTSEAEAGVPWLKDLPFVGYLFKSNQKNEDKKELLVFITPRILQ